jgi:hypothetical protein
MRDRAGEGKATKLLYKHSFTGNGTTRGTPLASYGDISAVNQVKTPVSMDENMPDFGT